MNEKTNMNELEHFFTPNIVSELLSALVSKWMILTQADFLVKTNMNK